MTLAAAVACMAAALTVMFAGQSLMRRRLTPDQFTVVMVATIVGCTALGIAAFGLALSR